MCVSTELCFSIVVDQQRLWNIPVLFINLAYSSRIFSMSWRTLDKTFSFE